MTVGMWNCQFEIFGRVQGVFFRKYTQAKAASLGIRGFIRNTSSGSVQGEIQGEENSYILMKKWLATEGSPQCLIDRVEWKDERIIPTFTYESFTIKH